MDDEHTVLRRKTIIGRSGLAVEGHGDLLVEALSVAITPAGEIFAIEERDEAGHGFEGIGSHDAEIELHSEPGAGTLVRLIWPAAAAAEAAS